MSDKTTQTGVYSNDININNIHNKTSSSNAIKNKKNSYKTQRKRNGMALTVWRTHNVSQIYNKQEIINQSWDKAKHGEGKDHKGKNAPLQLTTFFLPLLKSSKDSGPVSSVTFKLSETERMAWIHSSLQHDHFQQELNGSTRAHYHLPLLPSSHAKTMLP